MALNFPSNPVEGTIAVLGTNTYRYDAANNKWVSKRIDNVVQSVSVLDSDSFNIQIDGNTVTFTKDLQYSGAVTETVYTLTTKNETINPSNGTIQIHTLDSDTTYVDGLSHGQGVTMMITNPNGVEITWPTMTWATNSGEAPSTEDELSIVTLWKINSTLYGIEAGDAAVSGVAGGGAGTTDSEWVLSQLNDSDRQVSMFAAKPISALSDVDTSGVVSGAGLVWNGTNWVANSSVSTIYSSTEYRGMQCYLNRLSGDDPAIHQMLICEADQTPAAAYGYTPVDTDQDDFFLSGLSSPDLLCAFNVYGASNTTPMDVSVLTDVFHRFVDEVLYDGATLDKDPTAMKSRFDTAYNNLLSDAGGASAVKTDFQYYEWEYINLVPPGGEQNDDFNTSHWTVLSGSNVTLTSLDLRISPQGYTSGGMGWSGSAPNQTILITGDKLGGTTPENDLTATFDGNGNESYSGTPYTYPAQNVPEKFIEDGNDDQYDDGNYIGTDAFLNDYHANENYDGVPYNNHTEASGVSYFGGNTTYCVNYQPGMWVMFATSTTPMTATKFGYIGNTGSDGDGSKDITTVYGVTSTDVITIPKAMDSDWILRQMPVIPEYQYDSEWIMSHTQATIAKTLGEWVDSDFVTDAINNIAIPEVQADSEWILNQIPTVPTTLADLDLFTSGMDNGYILERNNVLGHWRAVEGVKKVYSTGVATNSEFGFAGFTSQGYNSIYYANSGLTFNPSTLTITIDGQTIDSSKIIDWDTAAAGGGGSSLTQSSDQDVIANYTMVANQTAETFNVFSFDITQFTGGRLDITVVDDQRIYTGEYTTTSQFMTVDFACIKDMPPGFLGDNAVAVNLTRGAYHHWSGSYIAGFDAVISGTTVTIRATTGSNLNYAGLQFQIQGKATLINSRVS